MSAELDTARATALIRISELEQSYARIVDAAADVATDDEHDPEGQTIAFERAQVSALLDQARANLVEVDEALLRERAGAYGICEQCGQPIGAARLEARPAARTCIVCASALA